MDGVDAELRGSDKVSEMPTGLGVDLRKEHSPQLGGPREDPLHKESTTGLVAPTELSLAFLTFLPSFDSSLPVLMVSTENKEAETTFITHHTSTQNGHC